MPRELYSEMVVPFWSWKIGIGGGYLLKYAPFFFNKTTSLLKSHLNYNIIPNIY